MAEASRTAIAYPGIDVGKRSRGNPCAHLPGYAKKQARGTLPGVAGANAEVIARIARGVPGALTAIAEEPEAAASVNISMLRGQDELASYCGLTPAESRSGTSVRSASPQRVGNRQLKNPLISSRDSLVGTDDWFGRRYDRRGARGPGRTKALKAVARKRLKVIYAIMRDHTRYAP